MAAGATRPLVASLMPPPRPPLNPTPRISGRMVRSSKRATQKTPKKRRTSNQFQVRKAWWKKGDTFTVDYIERAVLVKNSANNTHGWMYHTKWYLYSRSENTWEPAHSFAECEHPILERFWKSVGVAIPTGANEPEVGAVDDSYIMYESTQAYRSAEAAESLQLSRNEADEEEEEKEETTSLISDQMEEFTDEVDILLETHDFVLEDQDCDSDAEVEAMLLEDAFTQLAIEEDVPQFAIEEDAPQELPLFFEADDYETTPEPCSVPGTPPPAPTIIPRVPRTQIAVPSQPTSLQPIPIYNGWGDVFKGLESRSIINNPAHLTVAPLNTIKKKGMFTKPSRRGEKYLNSKSTKISYLALRLGTVGSSASLSGNDFRSTPTISMRDKPTWSHQMKTCTPSERTQRKIQFYQEEYTKQVNKNVRNQLYELPPSMELAPWSQPILPSTPKQVESVNTDVNDDAIFEEYIEESASMITLNKIPTQGDNLATEAAI